MALYLLKRFAWMLPVFFAVAFASFAIVAIFPGDYYTTSQLGFLIGGMSREEAASATAALRVAAALFGAMSPFAPTVVLFPRCSSTGHSTFLRDLEQWEKNIAYSTETLEPDTSEDVWPCEVSEY